MGTVWWVILGLVALALVLVIYWLELSGRREGWQDRADDNLGAWLRANYPQSTDDDERIVDEANRHDP